jgi:hypothetical protein
LPALGQTTRSFATPRPPGQRLGLLPPREFSLSPLNAGERARLTRPERRLLAGVHRAVPVEARAGAWQDVGATRLWRSALRSPGSSALRLEISGFDAGEGQLWVRAGDQTAGPYTARGPWGDGHFWTATLPGESLVVEYEPAPGAERSEAQPFEILALSHQTLDLVSPAPAATTKDPADICHLDPNCYPEWQDSMKMVAQITFEEKGEHYVCSGALVNTRDRSRKPYFLTAGHCINNEASARSVEVYWTYQTPKCGSAPPASRTDSLRSQSGANLIAWSTIGQGDYSLLLLKDAPSGVLFADWDMSDPPLRSTLTAIHHPAGSYKRISFGTRTADTTVSVEGSLAPGDKYMEVVWDKGRVEHGSSGSPLFSGPGVIVGYCSYGLFSDEVGVCSIDPAYAGFGRFSLVYNSLKDFMENLPAAQVNGEPGELRFAVANGVAPARQGARLVTKSTGEVGFKLRADAPWIVLPKVVGALSAASPAAVEIGVDPRWFDQPGRYQSTVAIFSGSADPQYINVFAEVRVDRSSVVATATPGAEKYTFKLKLEEKNGLATKVTAVKLDGHDFSASLADWFGTTLIPAKSALQADLRTDFAYSSGEHLFEFWGVDEATGRRWYTTATIVF